MLWRKTTMRFVLRTAVLLCSVLCGLLPTSAEVARAAQPTPCTLGTFTVAPGYTLVTVVRGLPFLTTPIVVGGVTGGGCIGPFGVAFRGNFLYVAAPYSRGGLYRFTLAGGVADKSHELNTTLYQGEPVFDRGALYLPSPSCCLNGGALVRLNPATGAVIRRVASNLTVPQYLAADPVSGNLFFQDGVSSGPVTPDIWELANPAGPRPVTRSYLSGLGAQVNGLAFAPNGVLYAADGNGTIYAITGAHGPAKPKATPLVTLNNPTGIAVGATNAHGQALSLWVATYGGDVEFVNLASNPPTTAQMVTSASSATGHIMGLNVGPDGCVYLATSVSVLRLARTQGGCAATK